MKEQERYWIPEGHNNWYSFGYAFVEHYGLVKVEANIYGTCRYLYKGYKKYEYIGLPHKDTKPKSDECILEGVGYKLVESRSPERLLNRAIKERVFKDMKVDNSKETFFKHIEELASATHDLCNKIENKEVAESIKEIMVKMMYLFTDERNIMINEESCLMHDMIDTFKDMSKKFDEVLEAMKASDK